MLFITIFSRATVRGLVLCALLEVIVKIMFSKEKF